MDGDTSMTSRLIGLMAEAGHLRAISKTALELPSHTQPGPSSLRWVGRVSQGGLPIGSEVQGARMPPLVVLTSLPSTLGQGNEDDSTAPPPLSSPSPVPQDPTGWVSDG